MKTLTLTLALLLAPISLFAQNNLNWDVSQLKNAIREMKNNGLSANGSISGDELAAKAEGKLAFLIDNYPDFDPSSYESEIENFKNTYNAKFQASAKSKELEAEFDAQYTLLFAQELFYEGIQIGQDEDEPKAQAFIDAFKTRIQEFLKSEAAALGQHPDESPARERLHELMYRKRLGFNMHFYTPTGKYAVLTDFYRLKLEMAWAEGLRTLFGEQEAIDEHYLNIQAGLDYLESPENAMKIAEKNAQALKAKATLYPEAMHDAALLAAIKSDLQKSDYWKNRTIENLRVTNPNWQITRHWLNGNILYRKVQVQCTTTENGTCILHEFIATEEYNGSSYSKCYVGYHNQREMLCENAH